jgi:outer membrane scaffolding protein for murein synthesis (MipA/OmpV family)
MLVSWYTVVTDKEKYMFFVIDYTKDTINLDNTGLYTLRVIKAVDKETQFTYWQDMGISGIYKPKE